ncbi:MAG: hypothetical protein CR962_00460 [Gammaproteobacteria bacterium]|nr:MAG: hypothetical protein CR962_00460 [Gammaproteobacteria bacterium]
MQKYKLTVKRSFIIGLLGLWCLLTNSVFAGETPQELNSSQWQGIQQQIQKDLQKSSAGQASQLKALPLNEVKLTTADGTIDEYGFGGSISMDGNRLATIAIKGNINDLDGKKQLVVYIFDFDGSSWEQSAKFTININDRVYGRSISLHGNRLAVGANWADIDGNDFQGAVYIFDFNGSSWVQSAKLTASDGEASDRFGSSITLGGNRLVIGATGANVNNNNDQGAVYIFDFNDGSWVQSAKLTASDGTNHSSFGNFVSLDNNRVAIRAYGQREGLFSHTIRPGAVYIFDFNGSSWVQSAKLTASDGDKWDKFGASFSLDGNRIAIGAHGVNVNGNDSQGAAYIFDLGNDGWRQSAKLIAADGSADDHFGGSISLNGNRVAIGSNETDDNNNAPQGAVYLFDLGTDGWIQSGKITAADGSANNYFGYSITLNDNRFAIGASGADGNGNPDQGAVYIYDGFSLQWLNGLSGIWYDPAYNGSGFNLMQLPNGLMLYYNGYKKDANGQAQWLFSDVIPERINAGQTLTATMYAGFVGNGGSLIKKPTAPGSGVKPWGQVEITLNSCNEGRIRLTGNDGTVTHNIVPLATITGLTCTSSEANNVSYTPPNQPAGAFSGLSGLWYDPAYNGSGFNFTQTPMGLVMYFYGYKNNADGQALWLLSDNISQPVKANETLTVNLYAGFIGNGGSFTQKPTTAKSGLKRWGQAEITFKQCNAGIIRLLGNSGIVTHNIIPLATIKGVTCSSN